MKSIDQAQRAKWDEQGYLFLKGYLGPAECGALSAWVGELAAWPEQPGKWMKWYEDKGGVRQLCRVEDFVPYHQGLASLLNGPELAAILELLMGERGVLFKEKVNFKLPGGAGFRAHQDAPAFVTFGQSYHVTAMLSVDATTRDNGCLEVVDGFHRAGLLPQASDQTLDSSWTAAQAWKSIETEPGDLLLFDSYVPHRSGPNRSQRPRRALYVTYNRASAGSHRDAYFRHKREAFPPECERRPGVDYSAGASVYNVGNPIY